MKRYSVVDFELSNICNANCSFCPRDAIGKPRGFMTKEIFERAIFRIVEAKIDTIIFSGFGEALLHKKFFVFLNYAKKYHLNMSINTNGKLLTKETTQKLLASPIGKINISINGFEKIGYERYMLGLEFEDTISKLNALLKTPGRPIVSVQSILRDTQYNESFKTFYFNMGVDIVQFFTLNNRSGLLYKKEAQRIPSEDKFCRELIFIGFDGGIFPCSHDIKRTTRLGSVMDTPLQPIEKIEHNICKRCDICSLQQFSQMQFVNS